MNNKHNNDLTIKSPNDISCYSNMTSEYTIDDQQSSDLNTDDFSINLDYDQFLTKQEVNQLIAKDNNQTLDNSNNNDIAKRIFNNQLNKYQNELDEIDGLLKTGFNSPPNSPTQQQYPTISNNIQEVLNNFSPEKLKRNFKLITAKELANPSTSYVEQITQRRNNQKTKVEL